MAFDMFKTITIGLIWQSRRSANLGVGALACSQIALAEAACRTVMRTLPPDAAGLRVRFVEFDWDVQAGREEATGYGNAIVSARLITLRRLLRGHVRDFRRYCQCDLIMDIGEGDSFADLYGAQRFWNLAFTKLLALLTRRRLVLSPQTIGPFERHWARWLAALLMRHADRVFARDALSFRYLRELGVQANATEVIDVAFRLPFDKPAPRGDGLVHVGFNVSALLYHGGYVGENQFGLVVDYKELVNRLLVAFLKMPGVRVHLIPHVFSHASGQALEVEDDHALNQHIRRLHSGLSIASGFDSPSAAKSYIAGMDFFVGARMHACIAAYSSGVPVVPLAYSRKFNGLFTSLGYPCVADLKVLDVELAIERVMTGFSMRAQLAQCVAEGNRMAAEKLQNYEDYLASVIAHIHAIKRLQ